MLEAVFEATRAAAQEALGISAIKGFPDWNRQTAALPVAALELRSLPVSIVKRIGAPQSEAKAGIALYVFARNESELCTVCDKAQVWLKKAQVLVDTQQATVVSSDAERYTPEVGVQQERHAFVFPLVISWAF